MSDDRKAVKQYLCPACFAREIDVPLAYDEDDGEYYCRKCCYAGKVENVEKFFKVFREEKYKEITAKYPESGY